MNDRIAPTALFSALAKSVAIGTAEGDTNKVQECVRAIATHFSPQTVLGSVVYGHKTIQDAKERLLNESARAVVLDRVRAGVSRYSRTTLESAYRAACSDCREYVEDGISSLQPTPYDQLVNSWSHEDHIGAVEIEDGFLRPTMGKDEGQYTMPDDFDPDLIDVIAGKAIEIFQDVVTQEFPEDPRQADLLNSWANGTDRSEIMTKGHSYISEVYERLSRLPTNQGIVGEVIREACTLCRDILKEDTAWHDASILKAAMIVLDTDNTLKKGGHQ